MKKLLLIPIFAIMCLFTRIDSGWADVTYPFSVTTSASTSFSFKLSAQGTFYVDCGDGGTLSSTNSTANAMISGGTIEKTNTTQYTFKCTYSASSAHTVRFGGAATAYTQKDQSPITLTNITEIFGDMSTVFPDLGSEVGRYPIFYRTFQSSYLTSIPSTLFSGYTNGRQGMFYQTFIKSQNITSLPENLFANITTPAERMFFETFYQCTGLTGYIPPSMFAGLIANGSPYTTDMMGGMFTLLNGFSQMDTACPSGTTQYTTGYEDYFDTWKEQGTVFVVSCGTSITCASGYYLPANSETSSSCATCPSGKICPGGTFAANAPTAQGKYDYTVTYSCGNGGGNAPAGAYAISNKSFTTAANICTLPNGYNTFNGWLVSGTSDVKPAGTAFTWNYAANKTLTAQYEKFGLITTSTDSFQFKMSAIGTFYVDCGDGGTLSGDGDAAATVSGTTITRTDTTMATYTCSYSTSAVHTISFAGIATGYGTSSANRVPISFNINNSSSDDNVRKITSVYGDLSAIFPYLGAQSNGLSPVFDWTFYSATNLQSIPETLFANYTGDLSGATSMFGATFSGCTGLTSIPAGLFSGITTGADNMFSSTFHGCTGLTLIPAGLFSGITTGAYGMFSGTFMGCTGLTSIPADLFKNITTGAYGMFSGTFSGCTGLTSIPAGLFSGITTGADYMFFSTFTACSHLAGYIPPSTFAGLIANGHPTANYMWHNTFYNTQLATSCPTGTTQYITGYEGSWDGKVSCQPINALNVTYACGVGGGNAPTSTTATYNASFTPAASTCTAPSGYGFDGWLVSGEGAIKPAGTAFTWNYVNDKTFTAQYSRLPPVNLTWYDNNTTISGPASCTLGSTFVPPTPAARPGYVFTGWKVRTCADKIMGLDTSINGEDYGYINDSTGAYGAQSSNADTYGLTADNTWAVEFSYGVVKGEAFCSTTGDGKEFGQIGNPGTTGGGQYCWCRATQYTPNGENRCNVSSSSWVFYYDLDFGGGADNCANDCANFCAYSVQDEDDSAFRAAVFGAVGQ